MYSGQSELFDSHLVVPQFIRDLRRSQSVQNKKKSCEKINKILSVKNHRFKFSLQNVIELDFAEKKDHKPTN